MITFREKEIRLSNIDLNDKSYIFTFEPKISDMIFSIKKIGLINPPILRYKSKDSKYILVSGFKRVLSLLHLNREKVIAHIIDEGENIEEIDLFQLSLFENLSMRSLNPIEKSIIISKLHYEFGYSVPAIIDKYFEMLNLGRNRKVFQIYSTLENLEDNIKASIVDESISPETGFVLAGFELADRKCLYKIISELKLGKNRQKEFIKLLEDIAKREHKSIAEIVVENNLTKNLNNDELNINLKVNRLRTHLRKLRYPIMTTVEERFNVIRKELKLPPTMIFRHPENFEGNTFSIEIKFKNQDEFEAQVELLNSIADEDKLKQLDDILNEL